MEPFSEQPKKAADDESGAKVQRARRYPLDATVGYRVFPKGSASQRLLTTFYPRFHAK